MANNIEKQLKEISERLEQGVKEIFTSERYTEYLNTMSKFHNYSFNNTLLITMQKPEATLVAGYQAWQKKFNRHVKRGEKGIQIIAPAPIREKQEIEKIDPVTKEPVIEYFSCTDPHDECGRGSKRLLSPDRKIYCDKGRYE